MFYFHPEKRLVFTALVCFSFLSAAWFLRAADLSPQTVSAFERYVRQREQKILEELADKNNFLIIDRLPADRRGKAFEEIGKGGIFIDQGKRSEAPGGLIHHWTGVGLIPGASLTQTLAFLQDYERHAVNYSPDVIQSQLMSREGNIFLIRLRFLKKKIVTVVLDTEHRVTYRPIDSAHAASSAFTTRISEVKDYSKPTEQLLTPGSGWGFLWKLNTYWRFAESKEGVYIQCETISLTRDIPLGVGWIVGRFVNSIPQESLTFTLTRTRECIRAMSSTGSLKTM